MSIYATTTTTTSPGQATTATVEYVIDETWLGFGGVHGGLLVAALTAATRRQVPGEPAAVSTHIFAPVPAPGKLTVETSVVHPGRTAAVTAVAAGVTGMVRIARDGLGTRTWPPGRDGKPANPAAFARLDLPVDFVPFSQHLDIRPINDARPLSGGTQTEFDAWIRLRTLSLGDWSFSPLDVAAILLDALPPGLYATMTAPIPIPTVEFTTHFAPAPFDPAGWLRLRHRASWASAGLCVDDTELLTPDGELAGQARQLRRITAPSPKPPVEDA